MHRTGIFSWHGYQSSLQNRLELIAQAGFESTYIWYGEEEDSFKDNSIGGYVKSARNLGLFVDNIHAPFDRCKLIWSENPEYRKLILSIFSDCILFCSDHSIPAVVMHICQGDDCPPINDAGLDLFQDLLNIAEKEGVSIAVENGRKPKYINKFFTTFDSPNLGSCFDSSHDALWGESVFCILKKWSNKVITLHLSDNMGMQDDHMIPGLGQINWNSLLSVLTEIKYKNSIMLEVYPKNSSIQSESDFLTNSYRKANEFKEVLK